MHRFPLLECWNALTSLTAPNSYSSLDVKSVFSSSEAFSVCPFSPVIPKLESISLLQRPVYFSCVAHTLPWLSLQQCSYCHPTYHIFHLCFVSCLTIPKCKLHKCGDFVCFDHTVAQCLEQYLVYSRHSLTIHRMKA